MLDQILSPLDVNVSEATVLVDETGTIKFVNEQAESLFGYNLKRLVGEPLEMLVPEPFGEEPVTDHTQFQSGPKRPPIARERESRARRKDGSEFPVEISFTPMAGNGQTLVIVSIRDITQHKRKGQALQQQATILRRALQHAPIVVWQQDDQLRYRWTFNAQLGYVDENVSGKRDIDLMDRREDARRAEAVKRAILESGERRREHLIVHRNGDPHYYDVAIDPLLDAEGVVRGLTCVAWEITSMRMLERELKEALGELAVLNETLETRVEERAEQVRTLSRSLAQAEERERQRIAQLLHDEIQQMLFVIQMNLNMLCDSAGDEITTHLRELETLTSNVIKMTRSLSVELSAELLRSSAVYELLAWLADMMARRYQLDVDLNVEDGCRLHDRELRSVLVRSVRELLFNVVKHAEVKQVRLSAYQRDGHLIVEVEDHGKGFEVERAIEAHDPSEGLGLSSVRERLRWHDGRLEIKSAPGQGTISTIVLPLTE